MKKPASLRDIGWMPSLDETMTTLFDWLLVQGLVGEGGTMDVQSANVDHAAS